MHVARTTLAALVLAAALPSLAAEPRDPFVPYGVSTEDDGDVIRCWPFATVEVGALRLEGTVVGVPAPKAILVGPDGRGEMVKVGTLIGRDGAQVKAIRRDRVIIEKTLRDALGRRYLVESSIVLPGR